MSNVPVEDLPAGTTPVVEANNLIDQALTKIGLPLSPQPGTPTAPPPAPNVNWPAVVAKLRTDWPGYPWPSSYNAEQVDSLFTDVLGRLGSETQYQYFAGLALQLEANLLYQMIVVLQTDVSALEAQGPQVAQIPGLTGDLAGLQAAIDTVARDAWNNLWSLYNNQVVPLVAQAQQASFNDIWSLYNNQVVPLVAQASQQAYSDLWALYNNQVVPLVAGEAAARQADVAALSQSLTQETALREQQGNTLANQVGNEAAARVAGDNNIVTNLIPGAIAGLLATIQPQLSALKTETDTCLAPLCDTVTPNAKQLGNLGSLLKGLEALGVGGLIVWMITEAVHDPAALSHDIATVVDDVGRPVVNAVRTLAGL